MNCDIVQSQLIALVDGELPPGSAAAAEKHLACCPGCSQRRADVAAVKEMVAAWEIDTPNISARVLQGIAAEEQSSLFDEVRLLRTEMAELRAEVAALRRQLPRIETSWMPPARHDLPKDYPRMENDPWNLIRS